MPENKFDLIKALSGQQLYTPINYGTSIDPNFADNAINNVRKTYPLLFINEQKAETEEEKKKRFEEEKKKALAKSSQIWDDLGNSEDVYEWYNAHESDPQKQEEFRRNGETTAGVLSTIATLPFTAGMMGWVPAITTTATGVGGGYAGAYGGQKLGQYLDHKYGWNTTPYLRTVGGLAGGILGGGLGYKNLVRAGANGWLKGSGNMYGNRFISDVAGEVAKDLDVILPVNTSHIGGKYGTYIPSTTTFGKTSYKMFERPSFLTDAERMGIPKGERNSFVNYVPQSQSSRISPTLLEVPESAFTSKPNPLNEIRSAISSPKQLKFVEDVTKGARVARTTAPPSAIDPSKLKDYTDEVLDVIAQGSMPEYGNPSWFKVKGIHGRKFLGEGFENAVFSDGPDNVLKFSLQRNIGRDGRFARPIYYKSLEGMIAGSAKRLEGANKYWFAEPTELVGYYNTVGRNGDLLYYPVYSQTIMKSGISSPKIKDLVPHLSENAMLIGKPYDYKGFPMRSGIIDPSVARNAAQRYMKTSHPQYDYLSNGIYESNIFLENDLPIPMDVHPGNFMYGKDGILRGTDLLKDGGTL